MAISRRTIATTIAGAALVSFALAGCSPASAPDTSGSAGQSGSSGQSAESACTVLKDGVAATMTELQAGLSDLQTDPDKAAAAVGTLADAFETTALDVTNADVRAVADQATDALNDFSVQITAYAKDPESIDQAAITDSAAAVQSSMTELGTTCP